jgi:aspartate kinase
LPGTIINEHTPNNLLPIIILKNNQVLLTVRTVDFSFFVGMPIIKLYKAFGELRIKSNFIQTNAIGVQIVIDDIPEKIDLLAQNISAFFDMQVAKGFSLLTLRHYDESVLEKYLQGKEKVLFHQNTVTTQVLYR